MRAAVNNIGAELVHRGLLDVADDVWLLPTEILNQALRGNLSSTAVYSFTERQRTSLQHWKSEPPPRVFGAPPQSIPDDAANDPFVALILSLTGSNAAAGRDSPSMLSGVDASIGTATGRAVLVQSETDLDRLTSGAIAVGFSAEQWPAMKLARLAALVTQRDDAVSHAAVLARELAVPAVVSVPGAMDLVPDDTQIKVDSGSGLVHVLAS